MLLSSISKKVWVALAGLGLCGFVTAHLAGNLVIFGSPDHFNQYSDFLHHSAFLLPSEVGLAAIFLAHLSLAVWVELDNRAARDQDYAEVHGAGSRTLASCTMLYSGLLVLVFVILHVYTLRLTPHPPDALGRDDVRGAVLALFRRPGYVVWYVVAMCVLGLHLRHALQSALRTLGCHHPAAWKYVDGFSILFGCVIAAGYSSIPLWVYFGRLAA
jgi:succinate dehydrogenase / fumarate reductase cytochrome b subunit